MASKDLYPPIIDSYLPAFLITNPCVISFSKSVVNFSTKPLDLHISIVEAGTNKSVVKPRTEKVSNELYATDRCIVISGFFNNWSASDTDYTVRIESDYIMGEWKPGKVYKIQIRFSKKQYIYDKNSNLTLEKWLIQNADQFSEWSSECVVKATSLPTITIPLLDYSSDENNKNNNQTNFYTVHESLLELDGVYSNKDKTENLYSYEFEFLDEDKAIINKSGLLYSTNNQIKYTGKYIFNSKQKISIKLKYTTQNLLEREETIDVIVSPFVGYKTNIVAKTIDTVGSDNDEFIQKMNKITSINIENEEGFIGIKLYSPSQDSLSGNIYLLRSDETTNYKKWDIIKIIPCFGIVNDLPFIRDFAIENGINYKYAVKVKKSDGSQTGMNENELPSKRDFEHSYLLGEGGRQLKINLNPSLSSYAYQVAEQKTDTIGGKFPVITRNGYLRYRSLPISGLVSMHMDDQRTFITKENDDFDPFQSIDYNRLYDYKGEHDFREEVLSFLQDGKPKLFKSAAEGNIIIVPMKVSTTPKQNLNRLISDFSFTGEEVAENTIDNYIKYNFVNMGSEQSILTKKKYIVGQLDEKFKKGDDIIGMIYNKYLLDNPSGMFVGIKKIQIKSIKSLSINFYGDIKTLTSNNVIGNSISLDDASIIIPYQGPRTFCFSDMDLNNTNKLTINDEEVSASVDFVLEIEESSAASVVKTIKQQEYGIGQFLDKCEPNTDIFKELYKKYYWQYNNEYIELSSCQVACIHAKPGTKFQISEYSDSTILSPDTYVMNMTGVLNLDINTPIASIKYIGTENADIMVDYLYSLDKGIYKEVG